MNKSGVNILIERITTGCGEISVVVRITDGERYERKTLTFFRDDKRLRSLAGAENGEGFSRESGAVESKGFSQASGAGNRDGFVRADVAADERRFSQAARSTRIVCKTRSVPVFSELYSNGDEMTISDYELLLEADSCRCALIKATDLLSCALNSRASLRRKLTERGFDVASADAAVDYLYQKGLIDEMSDVGHIIRSEVEKGYGPRRILAKLRAKGYCDDAVSHAARELSEMDFASRCARVIRKRYGAVPDEKRERDRVIAAMMRYGYSFDDIRRGAALLRDEE